MFISVKSWKNMEMCDQNLGFILWHKLQTDEDYLTNLFTKQILFSLCLRYIRPKQIRLIHSTEKKVYSKGLIYWTNVLISCCYSETTDQYANTEIYQKISWERKFLLLRVKIKAGPCCNCFKSLKVSSVQDTSNIIISLVL